MALKRLLLAPLMLSERRLANWPSIYYVSQMAQTQAVPAPVDLLAAQQDASKAQALLRGLFGIAKLWGLANAELRILLGQPAERTFQRWRSGHCAGLSFDTIARIGYLAGIFKALQIVYANPQQADDWIRRPNRAFGGQSPLQRMLAGQITDIAAVRQYIDSARAPWS